MGLRKGNLSRELKGVVFEYTNRSKWGGTKGI